MSHQNCQVYNIHEKRLEKAFAEYKNGNFSNPILQLHIYDQLALHSHTWTHLEYKILMYLCQQTIAQGRIRYGLGAGDIGYAIGVDKRSVKRVRDKLAEQDWIRIYESCCKNILELNIEKIMALGKKFTESKQKECSDVTPGDMMSPLTSKSYIIKNNISKSDENSVAEKVEKILSRKPKLRRSASSLERTWIKCIKESSYPKITSLPDKYKFKHLIAENDYSTEELHSFIEFCIKHWDYLINQGTKVPRIPSLGWIISCRHEYLTIWAENVTLENASDNVIRLKEKAQIRDTKEKWKKRLEKRLADKE